MKKGLVFGKFLPFHLGHKALIDFGLGRCDELTVVICASTKETISGSVRSEWITQTYAATQKVRVVIFDYDEAVLPNTSESSEEVSKIWSEAFARLLPDVQVLFTHEPYGEYVASYMGILHMRFDQERTISGTRIRAAMPEHWDFLPDPVKSYFQKSMVILGTESVGKSTLADHLSATFRSVLVREYGREVIPDSNQFSTDQLRQIAMGHAERIVEAKKKLEPLIVIDTDIHITQSYAKYVFGDYLDLPSRLYLSNQADLYLYLDKDVPFVQDGTRLHEEARNDLDVSHRKTLDHFGIRTVELSGTYEARAQKSIQLANNLIGQFR